ncbi:MAG: malectin domain-containing carbohydrate-binding protein, partial [Pseudomonadota bacterium]
SGNWETASSYDSGSSGNVNNIGAASGDDFIIWQGTQQFGGNTAGDNGLIEVQIQINTPGLYRVDWRAQTGQGTNTTEHNDTWLKIDADAFYGIQGGGSSYVHPAGTSDNDYPTGSTTPKGASGNGFFKVYSSGANDWRWSARTSDSDAHDIVARFDAPGTYTITLAARSSSHAIDRMVLVNEDVFTGDPRDLSLPVSVRADGIVPDPDPNPDPDPDPDPDPGPGTDPLSFGVALAFDSGQVIDDDLTNGETVSISDVSGGKVTLIATPSTSVGSIKMQLEGIKTQTESVSPYVLFGDMGGIFNDGVALGAGSYTLNLTGYAGAAGKGGVVGSQSIDFTIAAETPPPPPANLPPEVIKTTFSLAEDETLTIEANQIADDPEGEDVFFDAVSGAVNGDAGIYASGFLLDYEPDANFFGEETVTVALSDRTDQGTHQITVQVTFVVEPVNDAPSAADDDVVLRVGDAAILGAILLENDDDIDGDALTITGVSTSTPNDFAALRVVNGAVEVEVSSSASDETAFTYTVADPGGQTATATVTVDVERDAPPAETETVFAYNLGGRSAYTAEDGTVFETDTMGVGRRYARNTEIKETEDDKIFQSHAWQGSAMNYDFDITNGSYDVTLYFAEIYAPLYKSGGRVFDVMLEGENVLDDLDVFDSAGGATAFARTFTVDVADGQLDLDLIKGIENPNISGIKVEQAVEAAGNAPPVAVDDVFTFDFDDVYISSWNGLGSIGLSRGDLTENDSDDDFDGDGYNDLQLEIIDFPDHGELILAGEASVLDYYFDPQNHPDTDSLTYRLYDEETAYSNVATVTFQINGLPGPEPELAEFVLIDAVSDKALFDLTPSVILHAGSIDGLKLTAAAWVDETVAPVVSASMRKNGTEVGIENVEPYALYGDSNGNFRSGLVLPDGATTLEAVFFSGASASGAELGRSESRVFVTDRVDSGYLQSDLIAFDETKMGRSQVRYFEELDTLTFFGGTAGTAADIVSRARVEGRDTIIDFDDGNSLTLANYTSLSVDDILT